VNLTATITDKDGDFQTASIDLGKQLTIQDDGPTIGGFDHAIIPAQDNQVFNGSFDVSFGADGDGAMRVAIHDGAVNGYNLATTDLGGGITSVHVTGNGDDYTFYYATHAVSGGVELDAFFTNTSGTLSDPFFTLVIDPNGTYTFDLESVGLLTQVTVNGSDFGASGSGVSELSSPDGQLHITGSTNAGAALDVKASSNGIAVGDTGLQMDANENLHLNFDQEQTQVSFIFTQWQSNGTADVKFDVFDGGILVHEFDVNVARPPGSGDTHIVVQENVALQNTFTFDSATQTYTFYVGSQFNEIDVDYNHVVSGGATFTVNSITYDERTIPSTDLLFDVTAVDGDGDSSSTSLQVDLLGGTNAASGLALSSTTSSDALVGGSGNATLTDPFMATTISDSPQAVTTTNAAAIISGTTTGLVLEAGGASPDTPTATGTLTDTDVDKTPNTFTTVSSPAASDGGYGFFTMTAAGVWTYTLDNANSTVDALDVGDTLNDTFTVHTVDGAAQVVTITIHGSSDADPNDFDYLATGTTVLSDPPFVHGTPGHDSIAGGGDVGQIIHGGAGDDTLNGTGVNDVMYGGSGNDTIQGNNGDDTIYGGSGNDTINSNNGNDTIIGGFGADHLAGGYGNDRFVYLSVADSHAGQFDTISDFASGSDKIDLAALGALAFLALTSTSTVVPAHTIAWLYDSAANETIVYVNPTDQTLSIGSSTLLEIHLQGIATVQASDFDYEHTTAPVVVAGDSIDLALAATVGNDGIVVTTNTADVSSVSTVDDGALIAAGNWTPQTTAVGGGFDAGRDWFDLPGHAGFTFGEGRSLATEDANGDAVITLANGQSIEPNRVHVATAAENNFAFGQAPVPQPTEHGTTSGDGGWIAGFHWNSNSAASSNFTWNNEDNTFSKDGGQLGNGELIPTNAGSMNAVGTRGHTIDAGSNGHSGIEEASGTHVTEVASSNGHSGVEEPSGTHGPAVASSMGSSRGPSTDGGHQANLDEANGHGVATMGGAGVPGFESSSTAEKMFGWGTAGTRGLGDSFHFKDNISGLGGSNHVDPADVGFTPASIGNHENAAGASGPHAIPGEIQAIELSPLGQHSADDSSIAPNHVGGGPAITHVPHDLMV
jgi:VCBS repeat-containing protein